MLRILCFHPKPTSTIAFVLERANSTTATERQCLLLSERPQQRPPPSCILQEALARHHAGGVRSREHEEVNSQVVHQKPPPKSTCPSKATTKLRRNGAWGFGLYTSAPHEGWLPPATTPWNRLSFPVSGLSRPRCAPSLGWRRIRFDKPLKQKGLPCKA